MRKILLIILVLIGHVGFSQSSTTQELHKEYEDAFYLYFYKNTLKMLNQQEDPDFARLIDDIEKMKFLRIEKEKHQISREDVRGLMGKYMKDGFEELMSMREEDADIKVYIKEKEKITYGLVMLINDEESLAVLDIKGSVPLKDLVSLYDKVKEINN